MPAVVVWIATLVGALWNVARDVLPGIVGRIMLTLGLSYATTSLALPAVKAFVQARMTGVPADVVLLLGALQFDKAIVMILSAGVAVRASRLTLSRRAGL
jgi:predicted transporter